jgi:predicted TIM-barrel fold metal-dependent hydrolase
MHTRRDFIRGGASAAGTIAFMGCDLLKATHAHAEDAPRRREVVVSGKRVRTVDIHAHCAFPEVNALMGVKIVSPTLAQTPERIKQMDVQGVDIAALSVPVFWYKADRDLAEKLIKLQNEKLAELCAAHPDRFVAFATTAMQYPDLAVQQLEYGVKKLGLRGMSVDGHVNDMELADPQFHPLWAKAEELGVLIFIHPTWVSELDRRLRGNGELTNIIGFPLDHGGGYLGSYAPRSDAVCANFPHRCAAVPLKKTPTEYLRQLYYDSIIFTPEAMRHLITEVGVSQILMGTDAPFPWNRSAVEHILATPGASDDDLQAMLGQTAAKLLGIN